LEARAAEEVRASAGRNIFQWEARTAETAGTEGA